MKEKILKPHPFWNTMSRWLYAISRWSFGWAWDLQDKAWGRPTTRRKIR